MISAPRLNLTYLSYFSFNVSLLANLGFCFVCVCLFVASLVLVDAMTDLCMSLGIDIDGIEL